MNTLLIIDGNAIMHRAYHAIPPFKTKTGFPTHVIYGFLSMLSKVNNDFHPTHIIVCFDTPKPTFRNKLLKTYQIQRPRIEEDFIVQIPVIKEALDKAGLMHLELDGYEADDVIGTVAKKAMKGMRVIILTGDKDILQLVDKNVFVATPQFGFSNVTLYDKEAVQKKLSVVPKLIPDLKALMGDPSDNYKGAKGIGPKTAARLIEQFGSVDAVLKNPEKIESEKIRGLVKEHREGIEVSHKLATIMCNVPIDINLDQSIFHGFADDLKKFLLSYEMKGLATRLFNEKKPLGNKVIETKKETKLDPQISLF